jgi:hypothetical protein
VPLAGALLPALLLSAVVPRLRVVAVFTVVGRWLMLSWRVRHHPKSGMPPLVGRIRRRRLLRIRIHEPHMARLMRLLLRLADQLGSWRFADRLGSWRFADRLSSWLGCRHGLGCDCWLLTAGTTSRSSAAGRKAPRHGDCSVGCMQGQLAPAFTWQAELLAAQQLLEAHQLPACPRRRPRVGARRAAHPRAAAAASASSCSRFCWAPWAWPLEAVLPQLLPGRPPPRLCSFTTPLIGIVLGLAS